MSAVSVCFRRQRQALRVRLRLRLLGGLLDDFLHAGGAGGVGIGDAVQDRLLGGDERADFQFGQALDIVHRQHVERIGHRQIEPVAQPGNGKDLVIGGNVAGDQLRDFRRGA